MNDTPTASGARKGRYHHGDLRQALIDATRQLLIEKGAENFSLADACRLAGVTTAAPYKHFRDKNEILEAIVEQGFDDLSARSVAAAQAAGEGTLSGLIAMGGAYLSFATTETAVFRLMFGQNTEIKRAHDVEAMGRACFSKVIEQVEIYCRRNNADADAHVIALELWTFVHGASCLVIDDDYEKVAPGIDPAKLIAGAASRLLPIPKKAKKKES